MTGYLLDTSAWARIGRQDAIRRRVIGLGRRVAVCPVFLLEIGVSARNGEGHRRLLADVVANHPCVSTTVAAVERAIEVQGLLAARGQHRSAKLADLLIAATAEAHDLTVLHYDADYDLIAAVTGQPVEWVVPRGSVS